MGKRNMADKRSAEFSPQAIARAERQRLAQEEGARAMSEIEHQAIAVRKNMQRLRLLREAKEAEHAKLNVPVPSPAKKKRGRTSSR